jgi:hydroxymethylpyrimidine/phosphomethylpyrimidine kinase
VPLIALLSFGPRDVRVTLTVAGSDSGGGAGIQADLKTIHRFETFGTSVITAVTAQNTRGVSQWRAVDADLVRAQIDAVAADLRPASLKSGMLANGDIIREVAAAIRRHSLAPYVLDPVMVASSGDHLMDADASSAIIRELIPLAALVTPNTHEAAILSGREVNTVADMREAALHIVRILGARAALVKGGHLTSGEAIDVLYDGEWRLFEHPRINSSNTHGTGCTLSAAIAANLAHGASLTAAVEIALDYVHRAILLAPGLGSGSNNPMNHFA